MAHELIFSEWVFQYFLSFLPIWCIVDILEENCLDSIFALFEVSLALLKQGNFVHVYVVCLDKSFLWRQLIFLLVPFLE